MRFFLSFLTPALFVSVLLAQRPASSTEATYQVEAKSAQRKFDYIEQNGRRASPYTRPTIITENEMNAWLASPMAQLPKGVKKLHVSSSPGVINGTAYVDFDEITAGTRSSNPLLSLFSGTHEVDVKAHARGSGGMGEVDVDSVAIDGLNVPRVALEYFIDKYLKPKHPEIGMQSRFKLPNRIDQGTVGSRQISIVQR